MHVLQYRKQVGKRMRGRLDGTGKAVINNAANDGKTNYTFVELVACPNVSASYLGLKTCDVDFVRRFNEGILPIGASDNGPHDPRYPDPALVIDNACESALLQVRRNVSFHDHFFPKEQPYSLINMLNFAPEAHQFVGGTVHQAHLSVLSYHRWHASGGRQGCQDRTSHGSFLQRDHLLWRR